MKFKTEFQVLRLADLVEPPYNPRIPIEKGSPEYEALCRSLDEHGIVEPPVVNLHNMRCIGGNQRLTVLRDRGIEEVLCSVINQPDENQEKKLCLALNRIEGRWDTEKLGDLLRDDGVLKFETGFDADEVAVYRLLEEDGKPDDDPMTHPGDPYDPFGDDYGDEGGDEDEDAEDEDEDAQAGDDEPLSMGKTVIRIGHLHFNVEVSEYKRLVESIRDQGIFDEKEIAQEMKRRLLSRD